MHARTSKRARWQFLFGLLPFIGIFLDSTFASADDRNSDLTSAPANCGANPLHCAAAAGDLPFLKHAEPYVATLDPKDDSGATPLTYAVRNGKNQVVAWLLERGARVNHRPQSGNTPFLDAVALGLIDMAQLLLRSGADINAQNDLIKHQTALAIAAFPLNSPQWVTWLLSRGANPRARSRLGQKTSLLFEIIASKKTEIADAFVAQGVPFDFVFEESVRYLSPGFHCTSADGECIVMSYVSSRRAEGRCPIPREAGHDPILSEEVRGGVAQCAIYAQSPPVMLEQLKSLGVDFRTPDSRNIVPAMWVQFAIWSPPAENPQIKFLIENSAFDLNTVAQDGLNALAVLLGWVSSNPADPWTYLDFLIEQNADFNVRLDQGVPVFHWFALWGG